LVKNKLGGTFREDGKQAPLASLTFSQMQIPKYRKRLARKVCKSKVRHEEQAN